MEKPAVKPKPRTREAKSDLLHQALGGVVVALLIAAATGLLEPWLSPLRFAAVMVIAAVAVSLYWAFLSGWRLRSPFFQLPLPEPPKTLTLAEQERLAATRRTKTDLTILLHAQAKPAAAKLREVAVTLAESAKAETGAHYLAGMYLETQIEGLDSEEKELRQALESVFWKDLEEGKYQSLAKDIAEFDLAKQSPGDLIMALFFYYRKYRLLRKMSETLARVLSLDMKTPAFTDYEVLDGKLTDKLRELLALPDHAFARSAFNELTDDEMLRKLFPKPVRRLVKGKDPDTLDDDDEPDDD